MASTCVAILPLPPDVVAQIKSSATITSLNGVILGLLCNSLDAGAVRVEVDVNFRRGDCIVEDDGSGILPAEFQEDGGLGKLYYTSKFEAQPQMHGRNGTFLSSLAALSFITITSHHHLHRSHNTLGLHQSAVVSRLTPSPARQFLSFQHHGTRVTVRDLFGNMPVRVKQRALASAEQGDWEGEWEELKRGIIRLILGEGRELYVVVRDAEKDRKFSIRPPGSGVRISPRGYRSFSELRNNRPVFDLPLTRSILSQASYIPQGAGDSWVPLSATTPSVSIHGAISLDPSPTKQVQFISLGVHPVGLDSGNNMLYEEVNRLFAASDFGVVDDESDMDESEKERRRKDKRYKSDGYTGRQLRGGRKRVDRWPMFSLRINLESQGSTHLGLGEDELMRSDNDLRSVLELLAVATTEFLTANHFRPRARRRVEPPISLGQGDKPSSQAEVKSPITRRKDTTRSPNSNNNAQKLQPNSNTGSKGEDERRRLRSSTPKPDMLGGRVRLPKFSKSTASSSDSCISSRTRAKSSKSNFLEDHCGTVSARPNISTPVRTSRVPSPDSELNALPAVNETPLLKRGRLSPGAREALGPQHRDDRGHNNADITGGSGSPEEAGGEDDATDSPIPWINPVTNQHFHIDPRTGMASVVSNNLDRGSTGTSSTRGVPSSIAPYKRVKLRSDANEKVAMDSSSWIGGLLRDWNNPVFQQTEESIPQVSLIEGASAESSNILHGYHYCSQVEIEKAFKESTCTLPEKLSKDGLRESTVIAQVDKKFILVKVAASAKVGRSRDGAGEQDLLVIVDQHAADERCRIEDLLQELCTPPSAELQGFTSLLGLASRVEASILPKPMTFQVSPREHRLFKTHAQHFANWGVLYDLPSRAAASGAGCGIVVKTLPVGIAERCKAEAKLVLDLLRREIWARDEDGKSTSKGAGDGFNAGRARDWWRVIGECPRGILDMLNSRACRSAIMFNDELSLDECKTLVARLAECRFPFQCAHGRPSMVPLVDLALTLA